jgi:hypothetical protein
VLAASKDEALRKDLKMDFNSWTGLFGALDGDHDGQVTEKELYEYMLGRYKSPPVRHTHCVMFTSVSNAFPHRCLEFPKETCNQTEPNPDILSWPTSALMEMMVWFVRSCWKNRVTSLAAAATKRTNSLVELR